METLFDIRRAVCEIHEAVIEEDESDDGADETEEDESWGARRRAQTTR